MTKRHTSGGDRSDAGRYEIRLAGHLDARWTAWFDGLTVSQQGDATTLISGPIADQAALHGLLQRVRDLGLTLVSVTAGETDPRLGTGEAGRGDARPEIGVSGSSTSTTTTTGR